MHPFTSATRLQCAYCRLRARQLLLTRKEYRIKGLMNSQKNCPFFCKNFFAIMQILVYTIENLDRLIRICIIAFRIMQNTPFWAPKRDNFFDRFVLLNPCCAVNSDDAKNKKSTSRRQRNLLQRDVLINARRRKHKRRCRSAHGIPRSSRRV